MFRIKEGLEKRNTVNYDSYSIGFYDAEDKYYQVGLTDQEWCDYKYRGTLQLKKD